MKSALLLSPTAVPGGAERALVGLARQLPSHGITPTAVLLADGPLREWLEKVGCAVTICDAGRTRNLKRTVATIRRLVELCAGADLVVSNQSKGHIYGGLAARIARVQEIWWQQGEAIRSPMELVAAAVPGSAVVCSNQIAAAAQRRLTPRRRVKVIHLGTAIEEVQSYRGAGRAIRDRQGWTDHKVVGIVGRLQPWKGQETFLRAAELVAVKHADTRFAVVGGAILGWEGDYPERLRTLAVELGIGGKTSFTGHQDNVYPWFDSMDIVVHASLGEPFGLVVVEAMALGKPLVASASGGPMEIVEDGVSGILVPPLDHESLATAIDRLLCDPKFAESLGREASERATKFSDKAMTTQFVSLINEVRRPETAWCPLEERTVPGLHDHVLKVIDGLALSGGRAIDLGAGSGALATRLGQRGFEVMTCDVTDSRFRAALPFRLVDLDDKDFAKVLGLGRFDLVTATEVIEHVEAPISFLRNISNLLVQGGVALVTSPNVDSLPARMKFLMRGTLRMLDEYGDPTHISPIFMDLLVRQYLPRTGLVLVQHGTFPIDGFIAGRAAYRRLLRPLSSCLSRRPGLAGDNNVLVLRRADQCV